MVPFEQFDAEFSLRWTLVLLHFLWQGCAVALLAVLADRLLLRASANVRYGVNVAALLLMAACVPATFALVAVAVEEAETQVHDAAVMPLPTAKSPELIPRTGSLPQASWPGDEFVQPELRVDMGTLSTSARGSTWEPTSMAVPPETRAGLSERWLRFVQPASPYLTAVYLTGVGLMLLRLAASLWGSRRLRLAANPVNDANLLVLLTRQARRLGLRTAPVVAWCERVSAPVVLGVVKPMILLPASLATGLVPAQWEALLTHELAHIRRYDLVVNLVQRLIEAALFFHPAVWYVSRRVSIERENACDDVVLSAGWQRVAYADALVRMAELCAELPTGRVSRTVTLAASGAKPSQFRRRVGRLLGGSDEPRFRLSPAGGLMLLLSLAVVCVTPTVVQSWTDVGDRGAGNTINEAGDQPTREEQTTGELIDRLVESAANSPLSPLSFDGTDSTLVAPDSYHATFAWMVHRWQVDARESRFSSHLKTLIDRGPAAAPLIHQRLKTLEPGQPVSQDLILALGSIGTRDSIPVLIDLFEQAAPAKSTTPTNPLDSMQRQSTVCACTAALWQLSGRPHVYSPQQWRAWWELVQDDFVPVRERGGRKIDETRVKTLIAELASDERDSGERLIVTGAPALPLLLETLPESDAGQQRRLAWVIDELWAADRLPADVRRRYFIDRLGKLDLSNYALPIHRQARLRVFTECSFADFCRIVIESDRLRNPDGDRPGHRLWDIDLRLFHKRFGTQDGQFDMDAYLRGITGDTKQPDRIGTLPDPGKSIDEAVPVLIEGLRSRNLAARAAVAWLADTIAMTSREKPDKLIRALKDAWFAEKDDYLRREIGSAMARFQTPFVDDVIETGLWSDRLDILGDCAGLIDNAGMHSPEDFPDVYDRLIELTHHPIERVRSNSVRMLRYFADRELLPHVERLSADASDEIRRECCIVLRHAKDPRFAGVLLKLADEANEERVRTDAIDTLGDPAYRLAVPLLIPYLKDEQVYGYAVAAIADAADRDAIPILMAELEQGNDVGGMIYQHLIRLTGQQLPQKPEPWLAWWKAQQQPAAQEPAAARGRLKGRFLFDGEPPKPKKLVAPESPRPPFTQVNRPNGGWLDWHHYHNLGLIDESLIVGEDGGIRNILVWIRSRDVPVPPRKGDADKPVVRLKDGQFQPRVLAFQVPQTLVLKNEAVHATNFHWDPGLNEAFNVLVAPNHSREVTITKPTGSLVRPLSNNGLSWTKIWLFACPHPYFAVSADDGSFVIENIPPGEWEFQVWHERTGYVERDEWPKGRFTLKVDAGENDLGLVKLGADLFEEKAAGERHEEREKRGSGDPVAKPSDEEQDVDQDRSADNKPPLPIDRLNQAGFAELHYAAMQGNVDRAESLIRSEADVNVRQGTFRGTPLQYAAHNGHVDVARLLLDAGAEIDAADAATRTPLMWAAYGGQTAVVRLLLDRKANVNARTKSNWTPLHYAIRYGHAETAELLIERGADVTIRNSLGKTPLDLQEEATKEDGPAPGASRGKAEKPPPLPIDRLNQAEFAELHYAAMHGDVERAKHLIGAEANVNVRQGTFRGTPLQYAAYHGHVDVARLLLDAGAEIEAADAATRTPLMWAAYGGQTAVVRLLLDRKANVNARTKSNWTPLHYAISYGHAETAELLIERGADVTIRNSQGKTPLDLKEEATKEDDPAPNGPRGEAAGNSEPAAQIGAASTAADARI